MPGSTSHVTCSYTNYVQGGGLCMSGFDVVGGSPLQWFLPKHVPHISRVLINIIVNVTLQCKSYIDLFYIVMMCTTLSK